MLYSIATSAELQSAPSNNDNFVSLLKTRTKITFIHKNAFPLSLKVVAFNLESSWQQHVTCSSFSTSILRLFCSPAPGPTHLTQPRQSSPLHAAHLQALPSSFQPVIPMLVSFSCTYLPSTTSHTHIFQHSLPIPLL